MTLDSCSLPLRCETTQRAALFSCWQNYDARIPECVCVRHRESPFQQLPTLHSQDIQMSKISWISSFFCAGDPLAPSAVLQVSLLTRSSPFWGAHLGCRAPLHVNSSSPRIPQMPADLFKPCSSNLRLRLLNITCSWAKFAFIWFVFQNPKYPRFMCSDVIYCTQI